MKNQPCWNQLETTSQGKPSSSLCCLPACPQQNCFCPFPQALGSPQSPGLSQYIPGKKSRISGNLDTTGAEGSPKYIRNDTCPLLARLRSPSSDFPKCVAESLSPLNAFSPFIPVFISLRSRDYSLLISALGCRVLNSPQYKPQLTMSSWLLLW